MKNNSSPNPTDRVRTFQVDSLPKLLEETIKFSADTQTDTLWYRGVKDENYSLIPKAYRSIRNRDTGQTPMYSTPGHEFLQTSEPAMISKFRQKAVPFLTQTQSHPTNASLLVQMQHYGAPTRLLDWTENLLIAAYFAIDNVDYANDLGQVLKPAIWALRPNQWNQESAGDGTTNSEIRTFDSLAADSEVMNSDLNGWLPVNHIGDNVQYKRQRPLAVYATHSNSRIQAQQGAFTVAGHDTTGLEEQASHIQPLPNSDGYPLLAKFVFEPGALQLKRELNSIGYRRSIIYPGLESICSELDF